MNTVLASIPKIVQELDRATQSDDKINYVQWTQWTSDIGRIFGLIYGLLSTIILILIPIVICLELAYIAFPMLRELMDKAVQFMEGHGIAEKVVGFTLRDARQAVTQANTVETGKSAMWIYLLLKIKSLQIVAVVICIVLNYSGSIVRMVWILIENAVNMIFP